MSLAFLAPCACRAASDPQALARFEFEEPGMGTRFRIVLYAPDDRVAASASAAAFARLAALEACLSDYDPDSELSQLSRASDVAAPTPWIAVSQDLGTVLARAREISDASDGAFDVTCGTATRLWRRAFREGELPAAEALSLARASIDWRAVELAQDHGRARLLLRGMRLDLGGIAKGYALDEMLLVLESAGVRSALVDGGGDVAVSAAPPGERGWRIDLGPATVSAPRGPTLVLADAAVATSGDLERSAEIGGTRYSHIVDPRTAHGLTERRGASVVARDGMTADAFATAATVVGPSASDGRWRNFGVELRVVAAGAHGLEIGSSPGFARLGEP
ncbi:MAG TPA: FAD:protein FMN transferase [Planctomycetota bacterium]|nr:FAD:protein FMN transferase [Planctomycetota bacterium]